MKKILGTFYKIVCLLSIVVSGVTVQGCTQRKDESGMKIHILNVDESIGPGQYVCSNSSHYYYYDNGDIYDDEGTIVCEFSNGSSSKFAADDNFLYCYEESGKKLKRIDLKTFDSEVIKTGDSVGNMWGYPEGVFIGYDDRDLNFYTKDNVYTIYSGEDSRKSPDVKVRELFDDGRTSWHCLIFKKYNILVRNLYYKENSYFAAVRDTSGKAQCVLGIPIYLEDNNTFYIFEDTYDYLRNYEDVDFLTEIGDYHGFVSQLKPFYISAKNNKVYILYLCNKDMYSYNELESEILTVLDTKTQEREILYKTTDTSEYIINYSIEDNSLYLLRGNKVYKQSLDGATEEEQEVCEVQGNELGFAYTSGHLFVYEMEEDTVIGLQGIY